MRIDLEESSFPLIEGTWVPIELRLPPEGVPVYTISTSGVVGVYTRFGNNYSSLISTDNNDVSCWHESIVMQREAKLTEALRAIILAKDAACSKEDIFEVLQAIDKIGRPALAMADKANLAS